MRLKSFLPAVDLIRRRIIRGSPISLPARKCEIKSAPFSYIDPLGIHGLE